MGAKTKRTSERAPAELKELLDACAIATQAAHDEKTRYWWYRCYELEVEWVCNVVSAMLMNQKLPVIVTPTCRGVMQAAKIIGVSS